MNLELSPEQLALRDSVRRFLESIADQNISSLDSDAPRRSDTLDGLDLAGLLIPGKCGGADGCLADAGVVLEEIGRALASVPWPSTAVAVPRVIARTGVIDCAADLLRDIAGGSTVATIGLADAQQPAVRATRRNNPAATDPLSQDTSDHSQGIPDRSTGAAASVGPTPTQPGRTTSGDQMGSATSDPPRGAHPDAAACPPASDAHASHTPRRPDTITLDGHITEIPHADIARILLVIADDGAGPGLFAVEIPTAGVEFEPLPGVDRSRPQFRATLRDVPTRHLGEISAESLSAAIDDVLIAAAADALGAAQALFDLAVEYARTRRQFGRPIGSFQAVQHLCVDMYETLELARSGVIHGLWAADCAAHADRHLAAIRLKAFSGRLATMGDIAIQVFGGIGYTWEHPAHRYLERLLSWSAYLGSPDRYLREIGGELANKIEATRTCHRVPASASWS
jgi:alkylation response protein AidB-like acyl-CoA dehydrogenase